MLSDEEKAVLKTAKENYGLTSAEQNILVNLIEKQQKEIEKLKDRNKKLQDKAKELIFEKQELTSGLLDSIPNDKIKAKIGEYDDKGMTVNLANRSAGKTFQQAVHYEVKIVLQSLLEKE